MSVSFMYPLCLRCGPRGSFWFSSGLPSERSPPLSTLSYFWPGISTLHVPKGEFLKVSYVTPYFILPHYYQPSWCSPSDGQGCGVSACVVLVVFLCFPVPFSFFFFIFFFYFSLFFFLHCHKGQQEYKAWDKFSACPARGGALCCFAMIL